MVFLILILGIIASSSGAILIRLCSADPLVIAAYRMIIAAAVLIPLSLIRHRQDTLRLVRTRTVPIAGSGLLLALHFASWISSLSHTSVASSAFLVTTNPIFVGLGAWLLLRERLHPMLILGTVVAMAGAFWISYADFLADDHALYGDLLAAAGAVAMSGHLLIGRRLRRDTGLMPYITVVYTVAAMTLLLILFLTGLNLTGHETRDYALFFALAAGPQLLGHTTFNYALKRISPSLLCLIMLIEPVSSSYLAQLILEESPASQALAGGFVILAGIAIALILSPSESDPSSEDTNANTASAPVAAPRSSVL